MSTVILRTDAKMEKDEVNSLQTDSAKDTTNPNLLWKRIAGVLLIIHGLFCGVSALFPFHPAVLIIYMFSHVPAGPVITITLVLAIAQLVFGGYLTFNLQVRWYWPAIITTGISIIIAIAVPVILALFFPYIPYV